MIKLILFFLLTTSFYSSFSQENNFKYSDSCLYIGSKKKIDYSYDWRQSHFPKYEPYKDSLLKFLLAHPTLVVEIGYHTDIRGSATYNQLYSQRRADTLKAELVRFGIDSSRIIAIGYGESSPVITEDEIFKLPKSEQQMAFARNRGTEVVIKEFTFGLGDINPACGAVYRCAVHYDLNGVREDSKLLLDSVARYFNLQPKLKFEINYYIVGEGNRNYGQQLANSRAEEIRSYLEQKGVSSAGMTIKSIYQVQLSEIPKERERPKSREEPLKIDLRKATVEFKIVSH